MKILVISGFLGAGKTTFIKNLVKRTNREIAILENEYASAGMDGDLLQGSLPAEEVSLWEMTEGCICCSAKGDFAASVLTIANTIDPEYLIVEPTGVGMLSSVIQNLQQIEYERITLLAPITIVDGNCYYRYLQEYGDLYCDQLACAHTILLSKMENADAEERSRAQEVLQKQNEKASIVTEHYSLLGADWWDSLLETGFDGTNQKPSAENPDLPLETLSLEGIAMTTPERLILFLEQLVRGTFGDVIRSKGCIQAGEQILRFDVADGRYSVVGAEKEKDGKAVFIGQNLQRKQLCGQFFQTAAKLIKGKKRKPSPGRRPPYAMEERMR